MPLNLGNVSVNSLIQRTEALASLNTKGDADVKADGNLSMQDVQLAKAQIEDQQKSTLPGVADANKDLLAVLNQMTGTNSDIFTAGHADHAWANANDINAYQGINPVGSNPPTQIQQTKQDMDTVFGRFGGSSSGNGLINFVETNGGKLDQKDGRIDANDLQAGIDQIQNRPGGMVSGDKEKLDLLNYVKTNFSGINALDANKGDGGINGGDIDTFLKGV